MRRRLVFIVLVGVTGCGKSSDKPAGTTGSAASPLAEAPPPLPVFAADDLPACPYTTRGARWSFNETAQGVEIIVTSSDPAITEAIRNRARGLGAAGEVGATCPILGEDVRISTEDIDEGTKISIVPTQPDTVDQIRKSVRARLAGRPAGMP